MLKSHIWKIKNDTGKPPIMKCQILETVPAYKEGENSLELCLQEKLYIYIYIYR